MEMLEGFQLRSAETLTRRSVDEDVKERLFAWPVSEFKEQHAALRNNHRPPVLLLKEEATPHAPDLGALLSRESNHGGGEGELRMREREREKDTLKLLAPMASSVKSRL